ncbi:MAG: glutamate--tRNA ligase [Crocinitomicaceae bacterium]|nr:glutamate--tRNA ligase [Crocinitomicaceae bacterium]|tara:strand:- start:61299 stop:62819 length:1521 start_codon:yes stop_codon:yes gene_type:complete
MCNKPVRVRFAPSPTGPLHIGGVRTALYNYLFAKKNGGVFILRIEDTDQTRFVSGAEEYIIKSLKWSGISPTEGPGFGGDFGPYRQSERQKIYGPFVDQLITKGLAYYAFDTAEELNKLREEAKKQGLPNWQYNSISRLGLKNSLSLSKDEVRKKIDLKTPFVVRIKMPRNKIIRFYDEVRGWVSVNSNNIDDKVLFKSDGMPTYHLANVVDDYTMKISHVIRGEEWLPSAPLHVFLYDAFGWEKPKFAHLPLILKPNGNGKLSKRDGDKLGFPVFPLNWESTDGNIFPGYKEQGFFPDAFINMLAFLGWNPGTTKELFSLTELCSSFSLERVSKSGAKFDPDKTQWFQQQHLRNTENVVLAKELQPLFKETVSIEKLAFVCGLIKERATFVLDIMRDGEYFFSPPKKLDEKAIKKRWKEDSKRQLESWYNELDVSISFKAKDLETLFFSFLKKNNIKMGDILPLFRLLITGKKSGPSMFEIASFIGKKECLERITNGIKKATQTT